MRTITVTLAGREYAIQQLPIKADRAWREAHRGPLDEILGAFDATVELTKTEFADGDGLVKAVGQLLAAHASKISRTLLSSTDLIADALFAYSPVLEADRDHIEAETYPDEIMRVFLEVLKFAYPFGSVVALTMDPGLRERLTSLSSLGRNGESGKTSSIPSKGMVS